MDKYVIMELDGQFFVYLADGDGNPTGDPVGGPFASREEAQGYIAGMTGGGEMAAASASVKRLYAEAKVKAESALSAATPEDAARLNGEAEALLARADNAKKSQEILARTRRPVQSAPLPVGTRPPAADDAAKSVPAIVIPQDLTDPAAKVYRDFYGADPRQLLYDGRRDLLRYLRTGELNQRLRRQMISLADLKSMLEWGYSLSEIKAATMATGLDAYGGAWVVPDIASEIIRQAAGFTAVRAGGARVLTTQGTGIEWFKVTGGDSGATARYTSGMRGYFTSETASPTGSDFTTGALKLDVYDYMFKVTMGVRALESITNLLPVFESLVAETKGLDEDEAFLVGDGAKGPRGILPGATNADSLAEVNSGNASTLTINGLRHLKRGVAGPYRGQRATVIGESATGQAIEDLWDNSARHYVGTGLQVGEFNGYLGGIWREAESLASIGAGSYPLIYGDMSGYAIVERGGLMVVRFQDSSTGPNTVQFHVWAQLGGRVIEPWKLCVQKVSA